MKTFDAANWFWIVGGDQTKVWSSAAAGFIPITDPAFSLWVGADTTPARVASLDELAAVFTAAYPGGMLSTYAAARRYEKEVGGFAVNGVTFPTDRETQAKMTSAVLLAQIKPTETFRWKLTDGTFSDPLTASDLTTIGAACGSFVNGCFKTEDEVQSGIVAGTITTREQIDAAFAA